MNATAEKSAETIESRLSEVRDRLQEMREQVQEWGRPEIRRLGALRREEDRLEGLLKKGGAL